MARQKKYTAATLGKACERYFAAITRRVKVTEMVDSGKRDDKGHVILIPVPVKNTLGEEVEVTEYIIPPSMHELCAFLRIDRATWSRYMGESEEFAAVGERGARAHEGLERARDADAAGQGPERNPL